MSITYYFLRYTQVIKYGIYKFKAIYKEEKDSHTKRYDLVGNSNKQFFSVFPYKCVSRVIYFS